MTSAARVRRLRRMLGASITHALRAALVIGSCSLLLAGEGRAQEMSVPVDLQAALITKVLSFDRALATRVGDSVEIVVLFQSRHRTSREVQSELAAVVKSRGPERISGLVVSWRFVDLDASRGLDAELRGRRTAAVLITPMRGTDLAALSRTAVAHGAVPFSTAPEHVGRGAAVAFGIRGDRPTILIALRVARAAGADFGAQFLQLTQHVEE